MKANNGSYTLLVPSADGDFLAHYSVHGLCGLDFPNSAKPSAKGAPGEVPAQVRRWHEQTCQALARALAGQTPGTLPPLDTSGGTEFQRSVWRTLAHIGLGSTLTYGQLAAAIGNPKAVRAVGGACGANPIPVLVPCHRVLAADRKIGGFSGGLEWKERLLQRERVCVRPVRAASRGRDAGPVRRVSRASLAA